MLLRFEDLLPSLLRVEHDRLVCGGCRRAWRLPGDGRLSRENLDYLWQHASSHNRPHRKRASDPQLRRLFEQTAIEGTTPEGVH